nr:MULTISPECIES: glycosyltransferase [unclassified Allomuricauda]
MRIPIVVVAYNRPRSLTRLLNSLQKANYPYEDIDLIISIDKADNNRDVLDLANAFQWHHGTKEVVYQENNLGLRQHILKCGGYSLHYGAVIVLEDDLYVSPNFYLFAEQALNFSSKEPSIGGVSLYNHQLNVHTRENFSPHQDGYDNWYFQFASSWGQAWTREQWSGFMDWYKKNPDIDNNQDVPSYVRSWSPKSWLKYNIAYLVEKDLYFLYPKISLTTNFSDAGTHVGNDTTIFQVPLDYGNRSSKFYFSTTKESKSIYDAYFENLRIPETIGMAKDDICVDLYGCKSNNRKRYLLTQKILNYKILRSFGKSLKPHDDNIINKIDGYDIFLYDTSIKRKNSFKTNLIRKAEYDFKQLSYRLMLNLIFEKFVTRIGSIRKKIIK